LGAASGAKQLNRHVTIITNDFNIPWYWLKRKPYGPCFCEVCSLGMLQLATSLSGEQPERDLLYRQRVQDKSHYRALLINGSPALPLTDMELQAISRSLRDSGRRYTHAFDIDQAEIIDGSVLVLDGCSSSHGLKAWTDVESATARLIRLGAVGCVVTTLPVKNDPIVAEVLWGEFYRELRSGTTTVGQALGKARSALKDHFALLGSNDPTWCLYQLIGSPSVELFE